MNSFGQKGCKWRSQPWSTPGNWLHYTPRSPGPPQPCPCS